MTIEVTLSKNTIERSEGAYRLHIGDQRIVEFPMPNEVTQLVQDGYMILGVRAKEGYLNNYGNKLS